MDENFFFNVQYFLKGTVDVIISDPLFEKWNFSNKYRSIGRDVSGWVY